MRTGIALIISLLVMGTIGIAQQTDLRETKPRTVTVRGVGSITTAPDQVRLSVQINTRAESATAAMSSASARTRDILAIVKAEGVDAKEIQTSRVTVSAILDYQRNIQPPPVIGYSGTNEFSVVFKGRLIEKVGDVMDKAVVAGASSFGGLQYEASKQRDLEREALKKAALDARARADVLAKELGATLGTVMRISESTTGPGPVARGVMMADAAAAGAPVMTGELTISAQVEVVFELK